MPSLYRCGIAIPVPSLRPRPGPARPALERTTLQQVVATEVATTVAELQRLRALQLFQDTILPQSRANLTCSNRRSRRVKLVLCRSSQNNGLLWTEITNYLETRFAYRTSLVTLESLVGGGTP